MDDHGYVARTKTSFGCLWAVVIDDLGDGLGGKVPWERVSGKPVPSYVLETSPGNFQVGYVLESVIEDMEVAETLVESMIYDGLGLDDDPGMGNVTRYVRMPCGINGKAKYRTREFVGDDGVLGSEVLGIEHAWRSRLVHWDPERRVSMEDLVTAYRLDLGRRARAGEGVGPGAWRAPGSQGGQRLGEGLRGRLHGHGARRGRAGQGRSL